MCYFIPFSVKVTDRDDVVSRVSIIEIKSLSSDQILMQSFHQFAIQLRNIFTNIIMLLNPYFRLNVNVAILPVYCSIKYHMTNRSLSII